MKVKVLVIRFSSIGDIVLTTPVLRCLKNQLDGEVEIHFLTKKSFIPLLEHNPHLTKVHGIEKSTNEVIDALKSENFDYIVDLHKNLRSSRIKRQLPGLSFTFEKLNWQKWLLVNFKIDVMPKVHIVDRYIDSVKALGVQNDMEGLDYFLPKSVKSSIRKLNIPFNNYSCVVLGANHATKKLPFNKLVELVEATNENLIFIGGKDDAEVGEKLNTLYKSKSFNAAGKCNLHQSAFLISEASTVYTHDTGMMHIAAAFEVDILSFWGNTVPQLGMYPYLPKKSNYKIIEHNELSCRPCSKIGFDKCPKGHFKCMNDLDLKSQLN